MSAFDDTILAIIRDYSMQHGAGPTWTMLGVEIDHRLPDLARQAVRRLATAGVLDIRNRPGLGLRIDIARGPIAERAFAQINLSEPPARRIPLGGIVDGERPDRRSVVRSAVPAVSATGPGAGVLGQPAAGRKYQVRRCPTCGRRFYATGPRSRYCRTAPCSTAD